MSETRIINTKRNMIFSYVDLTITFVFSFVSRSIIIRILGDSYLGLSSLFTSILQVLNMADLGFSGAIVYNMYKPLAEGDTEKVCQLLAYYRKIYRIVGFVVLSVGLMLMPFLPMIIKDDVPSDINLNVLYIIYLLNTSLSYFVFAYKTALLNAIQRLDLAKIAYSIVNVLQNVLQIVVLILSKNYYLFLSVIVLSTVVKNLLTAWIADKKYPEYQCSGDLSPEIKKDILSRVKGLLICNISGVTYTTLDSIILSAYLGLFSVAVYNNYLTVYTGIANLFILLRGAMQSSVGNSIVLESKEKNYHDVLRWQFLFSAIATWCVVCLLNLYQPFMVLWVGSERLLPIYDVILVCIWFYIGTVQHSFYLYLSGNGLWWEMRWPYVCSTVFNLLFNLVLGKFWGITGIILSTVLASCIFGYFWQKKIIFKEYFQKSAWEFDRKELMYSLVCILASGISWSICKLIVIDGIAGLLLKFVICSIMSIGLMWISYRRLSIYHEAKELAAKVLRR